MCNRAPCAVSCQVCGRPICAIDMERVRDKRKTDLTSKCDVSTALHITESLHAEWQVMNSAFELNLLANHQSVSSVHLHVH